MRTIKELLILVREKLPEYITHEKSGSICWTVTEMQENDDISRGEENKLLRYLLGVKPDVVGYYWYVDTEDSINGFWWPYGELAPRLEFLDKLIKELDEN